VEIGPLCKSVATPKSTPPPLIEMEHGCIVKRHIGFQPPKFPTRSTEPHAKFGFLSRDQVVEAIESHLATAADFKIGFWIISTGQDRPAAGFCGFRFHEGKTEIELLYGLLPEYWGRGFATESSRAVLEYLWRNTAFPRVWAQTDTPHTKSIAVLERLGMRRTSSTATTISFVMERPG